MSLKIYNDETNIDIYLKLVPLRKGVTQLIAVNQKGDPLFNGTIAHISAKGIRLSPCISPSIAIETDASNTIQLRTSTDLL